MALFTKETTWTMTSLDDSTVIEGQFRPDNFVENVSGVWAEQGTLGLTQPIIQFIRGDLETITFDARIRAKHQGVFGTGKGADEIKDVVDQIRDMARRDDTLGRPHIWQLAWTDDFEATVVVRSVGGIRYEHARPEAFLGAVPSSIRGVIFRLDLARYTEYNLSSSVGAAESLIVYVKDGDFYESVARRVYNDANLGDVLRRRNPDKPALEPEDRLHIPPKATARKELSLVPASLIFNTSISDTRVGVFRDVLNKRSATYRSHLFKDITVAANCVVSTPNVNL